MFTKYDTAALLGGDAGAAGARILPVAIYETLVKASTSSKATNALLGIVSVGTALLAAFCSFASSWTEHRRTPLWLLQKWHKCNVLYMIILRTTLVVVPTFVILPLLALLTGSFVHGTALDRGLPSIAEIVHERTVANYSMLWDRLRSNDLLTPLGNTLICISVAALMSCFLGAYFGYRSARYFTRKRWLFNALILILYAVPPITLIFPFGVAAKSVGMSGILLVSLATAAFVLPFCLRLSADYFALVPAQLDNTAAADGAKPLQALVAIYVPKLRAQLGMVGAFAVVVAGNDILFSRYLGNTFQSRTFVDVFQERMTTPADVTEYGVMAALAVIVTLCAVLAFSYLHSRVVERLAEAKHS